jgi:Condensation domain
MDTGDILVMLRDVGIELSRSGNQISCIDPNRILTRHEARIIEARQTDISAVIDRHPAPPATRSPSLPIRSGTSAPLTFAQQVWWNMYGLGSKRSARVMSHTTQLRGALIVNALKESFTELVRRHAALRSYIQVMDGVPIQIFPATGDCPLEFSDASHEADSHAAARSLVEQFLCAPVDLTTGPLLAGVLIKLSPREHILSIAMDHMISDRVSVEIVLRDLWGMYVRVLREATISLPMSSIQFSDYALLQCAEREPWRQEHGQYWSHRLANAACARIAVKVPSARPTHPKPTAVPVRLGSELTQGLQELGQRYRTPLTMVLLCVYAASVMRCCDRTDIVIPFLAANRTLPEIQDTIGFFAAMLHLRIEVAGRDRCVDLLKRVTDEYRGACEHNDFGRIASGLPPPVFAANPSFNWHPHSPPSPLRELDRSEHAITALPFQVSPPPFTRTEIEIETDAALTLAESPDGLTGNLWYPSEPLSSERATELRRLFYSFSRQMLMAPTKALRALAL